MRHPDMSLDQLLADPLIRLVMSSDAVQESDIRRLASRTRLKTRTRPSHFDASSEAHGACTT